MEWDDPLAYEDPEPAAPARASSDEQERDGTFQVIGPPGCGKTTFLAHTATRAVEARGSDSVMVASLTRAAAAEAAGRDLPLNEKLIGTLHAHAFRSLDMPKIAETKIKDWNEDHPNLQLGGGSVDLDELSGELVADQVSEADVLFQKMEILRHTMTPEEEWPDDVMLFAKQWRGFCEEGDLIDFTGLIERAIENVPFAPLRPSVMLGDEAQDWSSLETKLFRDVWGRNADRVIMVGDPDQCIYEWRGADPRIFLDHPVPEENKRALRQSYRVPKRVVATAQSWVRQIREREDVAYEPTESEGAVFTTPATTRNPDALGDILADAEANGDTVMLLATCSYQLRSIVKWLRDNGVPFHNPYRRKRGDWNPLKVKGGDAYLKGGALSAADRMLALLKPHHHIWGDDAEEWSPPIVKAWASHLDAKNVLKRGMKKKIEELKINTETFADITDIFVDEQHAIAAMNGELDWFYDSLMASKRDPYEFPLKVAKKFGPAHLFETPKVIVGTVHSVKGGEADRVVLFPDVSRQGLNNWLNGTAAERNALIRTFYVGMTRARKVLYLAAPSGRMCLHELQDLAA